MFRWGHFSDIHFQYETYDTDMIRDALLDKIKEIGKMDAIFITGDVLHKGNDSEDGVRDARNFIHDMAKHAGCTPENVYICAGNHDLKRDKARKDAIDKVIGKPSKGKPAKKSVDSFSKGDHRELHDPWCTGYRRIVSTITLTGTKSDELHYIDSSLPDVNLIILNTAVFAGQTYPEQKFVSNKVAKDTKELENTNLYICDKNLTKLKQKVNQVNQDHPGKLNLVLAHHGIECFTKTERERLQRTLDYMDVDFYLCGHIHQNVFYSIPGTKARQSSCGGPFKDGYNKPGFVIGCYDPEKASVDLTAYTYENRWALGVQLPTPWKDGRQHIEISRLKAYASSASAAPERNQPAPERKQAEPHVPTYMDTAQLCPDNGWILNDESDIPRIPRPALNGPFGKYYGHVQTPKEIVKVGYREMLGAAKSGQMEYVEGTNLSYDLSGKTLTEEDYRGHIRELNFAEELKKQTDQAERLGYYEHTPKFWLAGFKESKPRGTNKSRLHLSFGEAGYLEQRVLRDEMRCNVDEQRDFLNVVRMQGNNPLMKDCIWASCGGGVWIETRDNYLVFSERTSAVAEVPNRISYSASGSFDRYLDPERTIDSSPGREMCREMYEELGLEGIKPEEITLISLGVDLERYLVQFSYYLKIDLSAEALLRSKEDCATTKHEQMTFFVPLEDPDLCYTLLENRIFEPGAAYSLMRLLQKRIGRISSAAAERKPPIIGKEQ